MSSIGNKLVRSFSFNRKNKNKNKKSLYKDALHHLEDRITEDKIRDAYNLHKRIEKLEMESKLPSPPSELDDQIAELKKQITLLEDELTTIREENERLKVKTMFPSVPSGDMTLDNINELKNRTNMQLMPSKMSELHNRKAQLCGLTKKKEESKDIKYKKIALAEANEDLKLLLQDSIIKYMLEKKLQEEKPEKEEYSSIGGNIRKKRKTKKAKKAKKAKKIKNYTRK